MAVATVSSVARLNSAAMRVDAWSVLNINVQRWSTLIVIVSRPAITDTDGLSAKDRWF